jgi:hypothetical protein
MARSNWKGASALNAQTLAKLLLCGGLVSHAPLDRSQVIVRFRSFRIESAFQGCFRFGALVLLPENPTQRRPRSRIIWIRSNSVSQRGFRLRELARVHLRIAEDVQMECAGLPAPRATSR